MRGSKLSKKYELTDITVHRHGFVLHQIRALRDFGKVRKGEFGGFIQSEDNLSHEGNCWVAAHSFIFQNAYVSENALIQRGASVYEHARIAGNARVSDATICGSAFIHENAMIYGIYDIRGTVEISGNSKLYNGGWFGGNVKILGNTIWDMRSGLIGDQTFFHSDAIIKDVRIEEYSDFVREFPEWCI